jgi:hypothetical protein
MDWIQLTYVTAQSCGRLHIKLRRLLTTAYNVKV